VNNHEFFTETIKANQKILFKVSMVYTTNEEDRKDLYQEIVIQLWKSITTFRNDAKISTWIYRIALNTAITQIRKAKNRIDQIPISEFVANYTESPDTEFEDRLKMLYRQIERLNDLEKAIVLLLLDDKSYEEIAAVVGLSLTNVATRISRIKQKLKAQINLTTE
jgi:RNA polymerase sigma-70 factor (ECF subfamily)